LRALKLGGWAGQRAARGRRARWGRGGAAAAWKCTRGGPRRACDGVAKRGKRGAVAEAGPGARHNAGYPLQDALSA